MIGVGVSRSLYDVKAAAQQSHGQKRRLEYYNEMDLMISNSMINELYDKEIVNDHISRFQHEAMTVPIAHHFQNVF